MNDSCMHIRKLKKYLTVCTYTCISQYEMNEPNNNVIVITNVCSDA